MDTKNFKVGNWVVDNEDERTRTRYKVVEVKDTPDGQMMRLDTDAFDGDWVESDNFYLSRAPRAPGEVPSKRRCSRDAVAWIALNDETAELDAEVLSSLISVCMIADLWSKDRQVVAKAVLAARKRQTE